MGKRKAYTPFSTSSEAGVTAAPVEGYIDVSQDVRPTVDTGFIDSKGIWIGHVTSDSQFIIYKDEEIANGGTILTPTANPDGTWPLDMSGYNDLLIGLKPTNGGQYQLVAVMGPNTVSFANLNPVDAADGLRIASDPTNNAFTDLLNDTNETCTADVWTIFSLPSRAKGQKLLQFAITNSSGGISTIETAFMRLV